MLACVVLDQPERYLLYAVGRALGSVSGALLLLLGGAAMVVAIPGLSCCSTCSWARSPLSLG